MERFNLGTVRDHMSSLQADYCLTMAAERQAKRTNDANMAARFLTLTAEWRERRQCQSSGVSIRE
jgi:hypothetical protein